MTGQKAKSAPAEIDRIGSLAWRITARSAHVAFRLFYGKRRTGVENLPAEGPLIYAANHTSHFDPPLVGSTVLERPCGFLAQSGLFTFRPFGRLIAEFGAIPLARGASSAGAIRTGAALLDAGKCLVVFPEGSRSDDGEMQPFKAGVLMLVRKTKATVVPIAIEGAYQVWPRGRRFPRPWGRIRIKVGMPLTAETLLAEDPDVALDLIRDAIATMQTELRRELAG